MTLPRSIRSQACPANGVGLFVWAVLLGLAAEASAHPISVVAESAFVERGKVTIEVEAYAEDLYFYHDLAADGKNEVGAAALREAAAKHGPLLLERLPVFDREGRRVEGGRVVSTTGADAFPPAVPIGELMGYGLVYRLELPLAEPPEFLSFSQRLVGPADGFPALVDFRLKQAGREEEVEATLKPGNVRTVRFDWSGGPAAAGTERETWMTEGREDALGATALNSVRSFLYVDRREVRHELLIPFPLLESYFTVDREEADFLSSREQESSKRKIGEFFAGRNPISIDGEARTPARSTVDYFTLDDRDLTKTAKRRTVSAVNARVGVILSYPLERPAAEVELVWDAFNRQAWRVDAFCFAGEEVLRPKFSAATRKDRFVWTRPAAPEPEAIPVVKVAPATFSLPWLSAAGLVGGLAGTVMLRRRPAAAVGVATGAAILAVASWGEARLTIASPGPPAVSKQESDVILRALHANLYRAAAAATDEEAVAALASAADGELLRSLALQLIANMRSDDPDESVLAVRGVRILSADRVERTGDGGGFGYRVVWDVTARLEHWGHVHDRRYRYEAVLQIEPREGRWLITGIELEDAKLIEESAEGML